MKRNEDWEVHNASMTELTPPREAARREGSDLGRKVHEAWLQSGRDSALSVLKESDLLPALVPARVAPHVGRPFGEGCALLEGFGTTCPELGLALAVVAHTWGGVVPLLSAGAGDVSRLLDGSVLAGHAVSEPGAGSDVSGMTTEIVRDLEAIRVRGSKTWVTNAPEAGVLLVYGRDVDAEGLSVVRVPADTPGLIVTELEKMGLRGARMGRVEIDCRLPPSALVGIPGSGMAQFQSALEWERASVGAAFVGAMQRGLDRCIEHARRRTQFGRPIGGFQAVAHRIVDMKLRLETSRLLLYRAADAKERGRAPVESSEAKLWIADALVANSLDAVRIFGAAGYLAEAEEARRLADAVGTPILSGTADIQRNLIAGFLGVAPPRR